ncbi:uncharacterized protein TNCV_3851481 [Trichonephila clavipes]|nr:uncharacterized protein TNCV_3851481 [Trichonephila clavipes]
MGQRSREKEQKQQHIYGTENILLKGCTATGAQNYDKKSYVGGQLTNTFTKDFCVRITNTFTKDFCVRITNTLKKDFLCFDNEHILGGDHGYTPVIMDEILTTARDLELERNVSPSEQEEEERGPMPTSAIKDLLKKRADVRAMVLEWHPNQADVSRVGDLYNNNAINYFRKILKKREKQPTLDMFFNVP